MKRIFSLAAALSFLGFSAISANAEAPPASYALCMACHQANGQGLPPAFPPLAGSEWVNGPVENLIRIQLRGLQGAITVAGKEYNSVMPPNATMTDDQIAEVLTYIRSSWGNTGSAVTADQVLALRSEVGKPMLTVAELVDPNAAPKVEEKAEPKKIELKTGEFKDTIELDSPLPGFVYLFFGICAIPVIISFVTRK